MTRRRRDGAGGCGGELRIGGFWRWIAILALLGGAVPFTMADNDLCLEVSGGASCISSGSTVTVFLRVGQLPQQINGVQVLLGYDDSLLDLNQILPGDGIDSPWNLGLGIPATSAGRITYSIAMLGGSTQADAVVARFVFAVLADGAGDVWFRPDEPPLLNKLSAYPNGDVIAPELHGPVSIVAAELGDGNGDGQVDASDLSIMVSCMTGPAGEMQSGSGVCPGESVGACGCFDFDADDDIDLADYAEFQRAAASES